MTTSAKAGVASDAPAELPPHKPAVYIVGFAPSWVLTPWDDPDADLWGMNSLFQIAPDKNWAAWFQLHDIEKHHPDDKEDVINWLGSQSFPVFMWEEHIEKYSLPNAVPYPRAQILTSFQPSYFTNTVSWQIALAILSGYQKIGIYGVDMAQDSEYGHQRPSCEWMIGVAQGRGIEVEIPGDSDLLKTSFLYGIEDGGVLRHKLDTRLRELIERRTELERQRNIAHEAMLQVVGAIENTQYILRAYTQEE
jgi:hypothetical protein